MPAQITINITPGDSSHMPTVDIHGPTISKQNQDQLVWKSTGNAQFTVDFGLENPFQGPQAVASNANGEVRSGNVKSGVQAGGRQYKYSIFISGQPINDPVFILQN